MELPLDEEDGTFTSISLADDSGKRLQNSTDAMQIPRAE